MGTSCFFRGHQFSYTKTRDAVTIFCEHCTKATSTWTYKQLRRPRAPRRKKSEA